MVKKNILDKVLQIEKDLRKRIYGNNLGLMNGSSGHALFYFNLYNLTNKTEYYNIGVDLLTNISENIDLNMDYGFGEGLSGIGWLFESLKNNGFVDMDTSKELTDLDQVVLNGMEEDFQEENFDYLYGALSAGIYFLEKEMTSKNKSVLKKLLTTLEETSIIDNYGCRWKKYDLRNQRLTLQTDVGLAHGLSSILYFAVSCYKKSIEKKLSLKLIQGIVKFYLTIRQDKNIYRSIFPSIWSEDCPISYSRLGWCYGDLSIVINLMYANEVLQNDELHSTILEILMFSLTRKDFTANMIYDAGICHGTAGLSLIYSQINKKTGIKEFKEASDFWLNSTLNKGRDNSIGLSGYNYFTAIKDKEWSISDGVLEGTCGIGLVLIDSISKKQTNWQKLILL